MPALNDGDRVLIIDRKLFKDDNTRFFVGVIEEYDSVAVRVRVISLSAGDLLYLLPREMDAAKVHLRRSPKSLMLTDGEALSVDLSEWLLRV